MVSDFSGVNPLLTFGALGAIFILGWAGVRLFSPRELAVDTHLPDEISEDIFAEMDAETLQALEGRIEMVPLETASDSNSKAENSLETGIGTGEEDESAAEAVVSIEEQAGPEKISTAQAVDNDAKDPPDDAGVQQGPMEATVDNVVQAPATVPRCSIFAAFPDERRTYVQATVIAGGLIILMLEVVFR